MWRGPDHKRISWLYANCSTGVFATADNSNMQDASSQDVYYREGESAREPKYQTVHGNPFMQWGKICPAEVERGSKIIEENWKQLIGALQNMQTQYDVSDIKMDAKQS